MTIEIPERLRDRPLYGDLPVGFYFEWVDEDGALVCTTKKAPVKPDFRVICPERWADCVANRWCPLCGKPLEYWAWIIGHVPDSETMTYVDPAMHEECVRYALKVCPFLSRPHDKRRADMPTGSSEFIDPMGVSQVITDQTPTFYLFKIRDQWPHLSGQTPTWCKAHARELVCEMVAQTITMQVAVSKAAVVEEHHIDGF